MENQSINVLLFSTLFPHEGEPTLGIFVENRLKNLLKQYEGLGATIIAPVPWFPFKNGIFGAYGRAARARKVEVRDNIVVHHPRYLVIPKIGMLLTPWFLYISAWRCYRKLRANGAKFDVIDAHYLYPDAVACSHLAKKAELPFVATARGSDVTQVGLMARPQKAILDAVKQASHTITVSANLKRDLVSMGARAADISVLRNGVDLGRFKEIGREERRKAYPAGPIMIFAGWLIPRKRLDLVLAVTKLLPNVSTVIVGDGPLMAECREDVAKMGISSRVFFEGQQAPEDMASYFSLADVLLLPSDREGWANVLLEAMACGTPVVSRAIGGAPDLIQEDVAGRVVDGDDPVLLAEAVQEVIENQPMRSAVREYAARYDWVETSTAQMNIFSAAIADYKEGKSHDND